VSFYSCTADIVSVWFCSSGGDGAADAQGDDTMTTCTTTTTTITATSETFAPDPLAYDRTSSEDYRDAIQHIRSARKARAVGDAEGERFHVAMARMFRAWARTTIALRGAR
jgi:hypothetical protein